MPINNTALRKTGHRHLRAPDDISGTLFPWHVVGMMGDDDAGYKCADRGVTGLAHVPRRMPPMSWKINAGMLNYIKGSILFILRIINNRF